MGLHSSTPQLLHSLSAPARMMATIPTAPLVSSEVASGLQEPGISASS
jgi:hypothetical protein